jgi:RNA polymerase sigma factor (sigma-70 family)
LWLANHTPAQDLEQHLDVVDAVRQLPMRQRLVVVLTYYEGMSTREVASAMRSSEGTVKSQLFKARRTLKSLLTDETKNFNKEGQK